MHIDIIKKTLKVLCFVPRAYELLSDPMRQFLLGKTAMHEGAQVYAGRHGKDPSRQYLVAEYPIVRTHPVSGKKSTVCQPKLYNAHRWP